MKRSSFHSSNSQQTEKTVLSKANKILALAFIIFFLIFLRLWFLCVIQSEELTARARSPQKKPITSKALRGTICDRYGTYLARNKITYNATVIYSPIRQISRTKWKINAAGEKSRVYPRKQHISNLSRTLGFVLNEDSNRIEDLIHSKASLFPNAPFAIKTDISEKEFYALKGLEKDFPGLYAERSSKRYYPKGKVAGSIIGYLGAISQEEYRSILEEKGTLEHFLEQIDRTPGHELPEGYHSIPEVWNRLRNLKEKAYTFHDSLGKTGIEGKFEEELRGFHGRRVYYSDSKGVFLKELPGRKDPIPGKKITLSISTELQEHAEKLLINNEKIREGKSREFDWDKRVFVSLKQPWIKGGAIVAFDPRNGEILALASFPRIDPSDFVSDTLRIPDENRIKNIHRWLETENHLESIWEGSDFLERESLNRMKEDIRNEKLELSWDNYLNTILPDKSPLKTILSRELTLSTAYTLQTQALALKNAFPKHQLGDIFNNMYPDDIAYPVSSFKRGDPIPHEDLFPFKEVLDPFFEQIPLNREKLLAIDLIRLLVKPEMLHQLLSTPLINLSLNDYRRLSQEFFTFQKELKSSLREIFHEKEFPIWREKHFKKYLREKREEEEERETYARPWINYLDAKENELFKAFWDEYKIPFSVISILGSDFAPDEKTRIYSKFLTEKKSLTSNEGLKQACKSLSPLNTLNFLQSFRVYDELTEPLHGKYPNIRKTERGVQLEKHLATAFYPVFGFNYGRSHAYQLSGVLGSIFKLVTSYTGLLQKFQESPNSHPSFSEINPFEMIDKVERLREGVWRIGYTMDGKAIPQIYKGGRLPRTAHRNVGKVDVIKALEVSSNSYFSLLTCDVLESPEVLKNTAALFSFGKKTGIDYPSEYSGKLPNDLEHNRTGSYTFAIGQHTLLATPLQTAVMMGAIANGGYVFKPKAIMSISGQEPERDSTQFLFDQRFPFKKDLSRIGLSFPLFTKLLSTKERDTEKSFPSEWHRKVPMPKEIRDTLLQGMHEVVHGSHGTASLRYINNYKWNHPAYQSFTSLKDQVIGKTSTSQVRDQVGIDVEKPAHMYKSIWFGGISFSNGEQILSDAPFDLPKHEMGEPELVVISYLRYGDSGAEAAPLVTSIIDKWREVKKKNSLAKSDE